MSNALKFMIAGLLMFSYSSSHASKCLRAETLEELKSDFPIIIRGKITERKKVENKNDSFYLTIHVEKILQGNLVEKDLKATEIHYDKISWQPYEVGKEYTFPVSKTKTNKTEVVLTGDGCPTLPGE